MQSYFGLPRFHKNISYFFGKEMTLFCKINSMTRVARKKLNFQNNENCDRIASEQNFRYEMEVSSQDFLEENPEITTLQTIYRWNDDEDGSHTSIIANYFMDYYGNKKPYNCSVVTSDGYRFEAHKVSLDLTPFFKKMLTFFYQEAFCHAKMFRLIMKSHKFEDGEMMIVIPFVNKDQMKIIMEFLYNGIIRCDTEEEAETIMRILTDDLQLLPVDADISPNYGMYSCQFCHGKFPEDDLFFHMRDAHLAQIIHESKEVREMNGNIKCHLCQQPLNYLSAENQVTYILYHYYRHETRAKMPRDQDGLDQELYELPPWPPVKTEPPQESEESNGPVISDTQTLDPNDFEADTQQVINKPEADANQIEPDDQGTMEDADNNDEDEIRGTEDKLFSSEDEDGEEEENNDMADDDSVDDPDFQPSMDTNSIFDDSLENEMGNIFNTPPKASTSKSKPVTNSLSTVIDNRFNSPLNASTSKAKPPTNPASRKRTGSKENGSADSLPKKKVKR